MARTRSSRPAWTLIASLLLTPSTTAFGASEPPDPRVCDDVTQRFRIQQGQLDTRRLNFMLFDAAERGCVHLSTQLLDLGASVQARDRFGNTALLLASRAGENRAVELLLERGSHVEQTNLAGSTALLRAAIANRRRTVTILLAAGANPNIANKRGVTPLAAAAFNGNRRLVDTLLGAGARGDDADATGKGALVYAAAKGYSGIVVSLLDAGLEVDRPYGHGLTALMWAAGHTNDVPVGEGLATVRVLLERGARHDLVDDRGRNPLMIAAQRDHLEIVALLMERGADPSRADGQGLTALDLAESDAVRGLLKGSSTATPSPSN